MLQVHAHLVPISLQHIGFATAAPVRRPVQLTFLPTGLYRRQRERDRFKFGVKARCVYPRCRGCTQSHRVTLPLAIRRRLAVHSHSQCACLNDRQIESAPMLSPARRGDKNNGTLHTFSRPFKVLFQTTRGKLARSDWRTVQKVFQRERCGGERHTDGAVGAGRGRLR